MEYPALSTVENADSGGARSYNSEEREGREPDGLRFDRERARRLWEAVSGSQPVGREEGESGGFRGWKPLAACSFRGEWRKRGAGTWTGPQVYGHTPWRSARPLARGARGLPDSCTTLWWAPWASSPEKSRLRHPKNRAQMLRGLLTLWPWASFPRLRHPPELISSRIRGLESLDLPSRPSRRPPEPSLPAS